MLKFNRGVLATSLVLILSLIPLSSAQAVSDEVAVQLLERLGELELELSNLRGENEMLRKELTDIRSTQREGFLEVDERVSGLEKKRQLQQQARQQAMATGTVGSAPDATLPQATGDEIGTGSMPSLAPPVAGDPLPTPGTIIATPTPVTVTPGITAVEVTPGSSAIAQTSPQLADEAVAAQRQAIAQVPASAGANNTEDKPVDPNSPDSYYFYGTQDRNAIGEAGDNGATEQNASKASLVEGTQGTQGTQQQIPDAHKAKAAYNQAYKLLVNDPKSAVPAFRAFMRDYPTHELVANAQYWLGEALYAQKDYSGATEEFMQVLKQHKGSPKAPGAALKLGYSFYELRQWDFARRTLEDTVRFFPDTNAATLAKTRLERMTKEGR